MGHLALGYDHGSDAKSMEYAGDTNDADCYGTLAQDFWQHVDPVYSNPDAVECLFDEIAEMVGRDQDELQDPAKWDDD